MTRARGSDRRARARWGRRWGFRWLHHDRELCGFVDEGIGGLIRLPRLAGSKEVLPTGLRRLVWV
jgi:hypothetical protein